MYNNIVINLILQERHIYNWHLDIIQSIKHTYQRSINNSIVKPVLYSYTFECF
jgi:hypothetical protein